MFSPTNLLVAGAALLLSGCARSAVELPTPADPKTVSLTADEAKLTCPAIRASRSKLDAETAALEAEIRKHRGHNQTAGYLLGVASVVVAEHNEKEKAQLDNIQRQKDRLILVQRHKNCKDAVG